MKIKTENDWKQAIAQAIASTVDGNLNDWEEFVPEADSVYKIIRSKIGELLLRSDDAKIRGRLNQLFGLNVFVAIFDDDSQREVRPQSKQPISFTRRTTRRRSSASTSFRNS